MKFQPRRIALPKKRFAQTASLRRLACSGHRDGRSVRADNFSACSNHVSGQQCDIPGTAATSSTGMPAAIAGLRKELTRHRINEQGLRVESPELAVGMSQFIFVGFVRYCRYRASSVHR